MAEEKAKVKGNKAKSRQGNREGKKRKRARYLLEGRREKNKKRKMTRTLKKQPNNQELRNHMVRLYGKAFL